MQPRATTSFFKRQFILVAIFLAASLAGAPLRAEAPKDGKTVRVLTIGNSFSQNATHYLGEIAKAAGDTLILGQDDVGGASMEVHWKKVEAFEKDPTDKLGRYYDHRGLKQDLARDHWDFVTIQQASILSHNIATYRPYAKELADYIHRHAPGAKLIIHETWEYRVDDPRFAKRSAKPGQPATQDEMYKGLSSAYSTIAKELGARELPVGDAFHLANHDPKWGYHPSAQPFDAKTAKPGELPDQTHSLNMGWRWKKASDGKPQLAMDGHHASIAGQYLGACVWYECLFGKSVENNSFVPKGLDPDYAEFLRATARRAVRQNN